jgi:SAM-dependent methyltransferase
VTWWNDLYDDALADVLMSSDAGVDATVAFLVGALRLSPGDAVFDQCAGTGRLAIPLTRWGARVFAVEQAARYVERARAREPALQIVTGDAFAYVPPAPCRGALNWWTSFGYLPDDAGNQRMLRRAFEALGPGGRFALDYMNVPGICAHFRPHDIQRRGELLVLRDTRLDLAAGVMHKTWMFVGPDGTRRERPSQVRMYAPDRLVQLMIEVGFARCEVFGDVDGQALTLASPRCIVVAERE